MKEAAVHRMVNHGKQQGIAVGISTVVMIIHD